MRRLAAILTLALTATSARAFSPMAMQDLFWASAAAGYPSDALVMRFEMDAGQWLVLPLPSGYTFDFTVDYGDGGDLKTITAYNDADISNQYAEAGTYDVVMRGTVSRFNFTNAGNKTNLIEVVQFGNPNPHAYWFNNSFYGCSRLTSCAEIGSAFLPITGLQYAWNSCISLTNAPEVNHLVENTLLACTWYYCASAKVFPKVDAMTKVTTLSQAWQNCTNAATFPEVNTLTNVTLLQYAWYITSAASYPEVSALTKTENAQYAWGTCKSGTSFPDVATLVNCTSFKGAWQGCTNVFSIPALPAASTALTNIMNMFNGDSRMTGSAPTQFWDGTNVNYANFPNLTPVLCNDAFLNCTSLVNYADIPAIFK